MTQRSREIIRTVMPEFGAQGPGFAINDPEVDRMSAQYSLPGHAFFVVEEDCRVIGSGGVAPLAGGDPDVCELRKMYFLPEARGRGLGEQLLRRCLDVAKSLGYRRMYLETLGAMRAAVKLYERMGFRERSCGLGNTGHFGCDRYFDRDL